MLVKQVLVLFLNICPLFENLNTLTDVEVVYQVLCISQVI